jgi:signal transduction histidine kinase/CheY-like chemotaxis protein
MSTTALTPAAAAPAPATSPAAADALRAALGREDADLVADHIRTLHEQTPATLFGNTVGVGIFLWMFHGVAPPATVWGWAGAMLALIAVRVFLYLRFPSQPDAPLQRLVNWRRQWNVTALASAAGWGISVWIFYGLGGRFHFVALILVVYAYMLAGVQVLATQRLVYLGFLSLGMLPMIVRVAIDRDQPQHLELAAIMLIVLVATYGLCIVYRRALESTIRLKVRTEHLAEQLRHEKAEAEAARRAAEVANRAKTQFFAAASHDLRQPLHALGLFAEALRQKSHDEQVAHLVNSINSSVDALEGLFSELLDITKIDTGGVEARPEHFSVGDLFQRLKLHFEPTAFEKGLSLRFRGRHHAFADPLLVDRIVRNLLSNAIRYTRDGGVLVSSRRRGERLLLQVWDTGVGIKPREQERIFEEFYQVPDDAALEPHQRKGLGLGLAIVRRLAKLMDAPLTLSSVSGRGTVFTLELPLGKAPSAGKPSLGRNAALGLTLDRRLMVVVEDEPAVRLGLEVLLKSWGASVVSFETAAACCAWAEEAGPDAAKPDLLIVDYRLERGRTGIEALQALRRRFGGDVPAILVTGSTMTGHEAESQAHDFHVLVKPVVPNKLRAMIAFKLGVR